METELPLVYRPKRGKRLFYCIIMLLIGLLGLANHWSRPTVHSTSGHIMRAENPGRYVGSLVFLSYGLLIMATIIRGTPRLTIDRDGLVLRSTFRTKSVAWDTLGAFTLITANKGSRSEKLVSAWAPVALGSGNSQQKITLPNAFQVPLATILDKVVRFHRGIPAGSPAVIDAPVRPSGVPGFRFAWMTATMLCVFVGVFVLEQRLAVTPPPQALTPSVNTLIAMGGLSWALVHSGQWYRLFTAPFLHAGLGHLAGNAFAFVLAGFSLERFTGRAWTFLIFAVGALAGSGMSLLVSQPSVVSVGAPRAVSWRCW